MTRAVIYRTDTGRIVQQIEGNVPVDALDLDEDEALLTDEDTSIPRSLRGKKVKDGEVVENDEFEASYNASDWAYDFENGKFETKSEALRELAKALKTDE